LELICICVPYLRPMFMNKIMLLWGTSDSVPLPT